MIAHRETCKPERLVAVALAICIQDHAFTQQSKQSNWEALHNKGQRFLNYGTDFVALRGAAKGEDERAAIYALGHIAATISDYAISAATLLYIYDRLSCQSDRDNTRPVIAGTLSYHATRIDAEITNVNTALSFIKSPAVAASGTQMKDDLRELKSFL